jgi:uridine kinase
MIPTNVRIVGICGASGSGKSVLASKLNRHFNCPFDVLCLDSFSKSPLYQKILGNDLDHPEKQVAMNIVHSEFEMNWEHPQLYDHNALIADIEQKIAYCTNMNENIVIIVEGFLLFYYSELLSYFTDRIYIHVNESHFLMERRMNRSNSLGWGCTKELWEQLVWPEHLKVREVLMRNTNIIIDGKLSEEQVFHEAVNFLNISDHRS